VLKSVHPSPLSAHKGFFDCGHFRKTNEWLQERYGVEGTINWDLDVKAPTKAPENKEAVKVTAEQRGEERWVSETEGSEENGKTVPQGDDFGDDDEDAIAAMEELAKEEAKAVDNDSQKTIS
jgi:uracil-DNA glycosylase